MQTIFQIWKLKEQKENCILNFFSMKLETISAKQLEIIFSILIEEFLDPKSPNVLLLLIKNIFRV